MQLPLEILANDGNLCGEGPHWDPRDQALYWTDIDGGRLFQYLGRERRHQVILDGFSCNGFTLQQDNTFVLTNTLGFWLWRRGEQPQLLVSSAEGQQCRLNDCLADPEGRIYSGSYHLDQQGHSSPSYLFLMDTDGNARIVDDGIRFGNGLALSPDGGTLYFTDFAARCVYAYTRQSRDGSLHHRRIFLQLDRSEGLPDGLTVDSQGFLWCAHWFGGCVTRYDPDGKRERRIQTPATQTSSLALGGQDMCDLYITSAALHNCLMLAPDGYDPSRVFPGGPLYRLRTDIQGVPKHRSHVFPRNQV